MKSFCFSSSADCSRIATDQDALRLRSFLIQATLCAIQIWKKYDCLNHQSNMIWFIEVHNPTWFGLSKFTLSSSPQDHGTWRGSALAGSKALTWVMPYGSRIGQCSSPLSSKSFAQLWYEESKLDTIWERTRTAMRFMIYVLIGASLCNIWIKNVEPKPLAPHLLLQLLCLWPLVFGSPHVCESGSTQSCSGHLPLQVQVDKGSNQYPRLTHFPMQSLHCAMTLLPCPSGTQTPKPQQRP